ncbi:efflux RND transporter periplasmic adaptor subunit [Agarivorans aestuarii]|uniref:Efflux RND transporter periplasmic adaptor subunit n=1 Tax=Agarivorans aestuarii TaxID=1563703 RepID=A0ABU7FZI0_9ALTE|nr:efflux RND transporter periplasmic adaptor subunit [Agarivorans aestuarii]MEE1672422.1 efflux RND transporter periplasmic adaptor subunit [Agarivorans aestuarii]
MKIRLISLLLASVFISACETSNTAEVSSTQTTDAIEVDLANANQQQLTFEEVYTTTVLANEEIRVISRLTSTLLDKHFQAGDYVEKGQLLFSLDPLEFELNLASLQANLVNVRAKYNSALKSLQRAKQLGDAISKQELEDIETKFLVNQASLKAIEKQVDDAELLLSRTNIKATRSGRISQTQYSPGDTVGVGQVLASIVDDSDFKVTVSIDEKTVLQAIQQYRDGKSQFEVLARFLDGSVYPIGGDLDFIDNQINPATGALAVGFKFANDDSVFVGQFVEVILREVKQAVVIPSRALVQTANGPAVFKVSRGKAQLQPIELGFQLGNQTEVITGLEDGSVVVSRGQQKLSDGSQVRQRG